MKLAEEGVVAGAGPNLPRVGRSGPGDPQATVSIVTHVIAVRISRPGASHPKALTRRIVLILQLDPRTLIRTKLTSSQKLTITLAIM